jgi:cytoplasmic iron level regulating protein YaaA (DUF328/UPF0246 family)
MRKPRVKSSDMSKMKKVMQMVFKDGKVKGKYGRHAKGYFVEVIINSL